MKIWLDTSASRPAVEGRGVPGGAEQAKNGERECECTPTRASSIVTRLAFARTRRFHLAASCRVLQCTAGRWLVCNPLSVGRVAVLDDKARQLLECFRQPASAEEVACLCTGIAPAQVARAVSIFWELGLFQGTHTLAPSSGPPGNDTLVAWLHVTNACNLRCQYCYVQKSTERMSEDIALRAVDAIFRSARQDGYMGVRIKYAGGEASLELRRVLAVHDYAVQQARARQIHLQGLLLSNGVALSGHTIEQLKKRDIAVTISLDGIAASHDVQRPMTRGGGSFAFVDRSIQRLLAQQLVPTISVTVTQRNLAGLPDLMAYILQRDVPFTLNFYRDNEHAQDREHLLCQEQAMIEALRTAFRVIEHSLPKRALLGALLDRTSAQGPHAHACGVGQNYLVINQQGGITRCHAAPEQQITTIASPHPLRVLQNSQQGPQQVPVEQKQGCRTCTWRYWCTGGCPLLTWQLTGRYDVQSPYCQIYQALFPDVLRLEALRLLQYEVPLDLAEGETSPAGADVYSLFDAAGELAAGRGAAQVGV
ncbi:MAG TPA: SPASM domain-containing protein [Ktedonobacteraceae bacterium]|jgi:uncharacterized protein